MTLNTFKMGLKTALITGITGQDGGYLARFLLGKGYRVHGLVRPEVSDRMDNIADLLDHPKLSLHYGDLTDLANVTRLLIAHRPHEFYNLGAQSHVGISFDNPITTSDIIAGGTLNCLEAIRLAGLENQTRFYQASSSELFGNAPAPQDEMTPFQPCSPYAVAKLHAYWMTVTYRNSYGLHASNGILFNHESPRRGAEFVTRKVTKHVARIAAGDTAPLKIGNLDSVRDWGYAPDFVEGMWRMLQQDEPDDYVLATGHTNTVRQLIEYAFAAIHIRLSWAGSGLNETGRNAATGEKLVVIDPQFFRPNEVHHLCGNATKARQKLGWKPKTPFKDMIHIMVEADCKALGMPVPEPLAFAAQ